MNLIFSHNIVTRSIAYIFVNTECQDVPYRNAKERGEKARKLLESVLEFQRVTAFKNNTKQEIINHLTQLQAYADAFEQEIADKRDRVEKIKGEVPKMVKAVFDEYIKSKGQIGLDFNQAFECSNKIATQLGEPKLSKREFKDVFAKLDFDGNEEVELEEMINYVTECLERQEILMIGIVWIGHTL